MKASVIIPVYNASSFIRDCLDSVDRQTMKENVECILIEDCGQDNSIELIEKHILQYQGEVSFRLIKQKENQGPSAARNRGIREATGDYIFFLDADDTIPPRCIETLYTHAISNNLDYVQGCYQGEKSKALKPLIFDKKEIKRTLLNYNLVPFTPHNRLVRRKMLLENNLFFNEEIRVREDFLWMTFVAKYVERFGYCPEVTYIRGYNEESLTHKVNIEREIIGYRVLIETMCVNIDPFLIGSQKELILSTLIMCLNARYYHNVDEKKHLIEVVKKQNNFFQNILLSLLLNMKVGVIRTKLLHLLIRLYKLNG